VLASYGVPAQAYLIDVPTLVRVSTQTKLPILVNVLEPEPHYALVLGVQDGQVILADPALGLRTEPLNSFRTSWNGTAVVVTPSEHQWRRGRAATGSVLARMADRAARLRSVR